MAFGGKEREGEGEMSPRLIGHWPGPADWNWINVPHSLEFALKCHPFLFSLLSWDCLSQVSGCGKIGRMERENWKKRKESFPT